MHTRGGQLARARRIASIFQRGGTRRFAHAIRASAPSVIGCPSSSPGSLLQLRVEKTEPLFFFPFPFPHHNHTTAAVFLT